MPVDRAEGGRLARAVRADQRDDLALVHVERDALERLDASVGGPQALDSSRGSPAAAPSRAGSRLARRGRPGSRGRPRSLPGRAGSRSGCPRRSCAPWSSTVTRSETCITTRMSCSINSTVRPRSSRRRCTKAMNAARLLRVHAGGRLVEQHQLRARWPARGRPPAGAGRRSSGCARTPARCRSARPQ